MRYKIILSSAVIASFMIGCGGGSSSDSSTDTDISKRQITVERGPVYGAIVKDAKGQVAKNTSTNVYTFDTNPYYPITVEQNPDGGTFIDVDGDGKKSNDDINLTISLKSCSNIVTPISTYVYDKSNCASEQLEETYQTLNLQLHIDEAELKALPSKMKDINAIIASNAAYLEMVKNPNSKVEISQIQTQMETIKTYISENNTTTTAIEQVVVENNQDVFTSEPTLLVNKFELGKKYYIFEDDRTYLKELYIKDSSDWVETEFHFNASTKQWSSNISPEANEDYVLVNGQWKPEGEFPHVLNSDGTISYYVEKYTLKNATAIQGKQNIMFNGNNIEVDFPAGSISYTNNTTNTSSELGYGFGIDSDRANSFQELIQKYCGNSAFSTEGNLGISFAGTKGDGNYTCDTNATSGNIFEVLNGKTEEKVVGTWEIKQIQGNDILITNVNEYTKYNDNNDSVLFALYNGKVKYGWLFANGEEENEIVYNETAINTIKEAIAK